MFPGVFAAGNGCGLPSLSSREGYTTIRQAARRLGVHRTTVERLIASGELRAIQLPGCWARIVTADVDALIAKVVADAS